VTCWNGHVLRLAPRLLFALVLACTGVVLTQMPAHACRCVQHGVQDHADRADVVFSGVLVDTSPGTSGRKEKRATIYEIDAETLYQGNITTDSVDVVSLDTSCSLGDLKRDRSYVFFVKEKGAELRADQCGGTERARDDYLRKVQRVLGEGTTLGAPTTGEPIEPEFTPVAGAEPETLTRLAAPGAALVLVGLLGLIVVRRATRD
jgi:hypothetical protein